MTIAAPTTGLFFRIFIKDIYEESRKEIFMSDEEKVNKFEQLKTVIEAYNRCLYEDRDDGEYRMMFYNMTEKLMQILRT